METGIEETFSRLKQRSKGGDSNGQVNGLFGITSKVTSISLLVMGKVI
jgi:hypothetical protein